MMSGYKNQAQIDAAQELLQSIAPGARFNGFLLRNGGEEASKAYFEIPAKGNKEIIDSLVKAGFKKSYKYLGFDDPREGLNRHASRHYRQTFEIELPKQTAEAP